jgi:hypothetical protein
MGISPCCRRGCIEHDFAKGLMNRAITGTVVKVVEMGVNARSSTAAEKSGEGMALKIFTGAKPFLKAEQSLLVSRKKMLTHLISYS